MPYRVLLCSEDFELARLRQAVFHVRGHELIYCVQEDDAVQRIRDKTFDCLILCHQLNPTACIRIVNECRRCKPRTPIVAILKGDYVTQAVSSIDLYVSGADGPRILIEMVETAIENGRRQPAA